MKRGQTSTEYIILVAMVIVIGVSVVSLMNGNSDMSIGAKQKQSDFEIKTGEVSVENYYVGSASTLIKIRNNYIEPITVSSFDFGNVTCDDSSLPLNLKIGEFYTLNCSNLDSTMISTELRPEVSVDWKSQSDNAVYNMYFEGAIAVGQPLDCNQNESTGSAAGVFYDGDGSLGSPYGICNCSMLQEVENYLTSNYVLLRNVDCSDTVNWNSGEGFNPIGCGSSNCGSRTLNSEFTGLLDGSGYAISDLYINRPTERYVGLFGSTYASSSVYGEIINLTLSGIDYIGSTYTAGISAYALYINLNNSHTSGDIFAYSTSGGLVGYGSYGEVRDSSSSVNMRASSAQNVGGLIGYGQYFNLTNSYFAGEIYTSASFVGGLIGRCDDSVVRDSYSTSNINGTIYLGGICGYGGNLILDNTYSTGNLNSTTYAADQYSYIGGLIGSSSSPVISNSYSTSNLNSVGRSVGGLVGSGVWPIITDSYFGGVINSTSTSGLVYIGGLVGDGSRAKIYNSNFSGKIYSLGGFVGGLLGGPISTHLDPFIINNSFSSGIVSGDSTTGGLVGYGTIGKIINSSFIGTVSTVGNSAGGLIATGYTVNITDSWTYVNISGSTYLSGMFAYGYGIVNRSYVVANISGSNYIGGIFAYASGSPRIVENSYSIVNITGNPYNAGGITGGNTFYLDKVYSTGYIDGDYYLGGLIGQTGTVTVNNSFSSVVITGNSNVGGIIGDGDSVNVVENSYWYEAGNASVCIGDWGHACSSWKYSNISDFNYYNNSPMDTWDFDTIWDDSLNGTGLPTLR